MNSSLTDIREAKLIAKRIFELYDKDRNGILDPQELSPMLQDIYRPLSQSYIPSKPDVDMYMRILDKNNDGKVTLQDFEENAIKYFVRNDLGDQSRMEKKEGAKKKGVYSPDLMNKIEIGKRVFGACDNKKSGLIQLVQIPDVIEQTFSSLGISNYSLSQDDIVGIMNNFSFENNQKVNLQEFQEMLIRCLREVGQINE